MGASDRKKTGHREITSHVSIHTIHLDGLRELYRHFLRLPDGAIVEVRKCFFVINLPLSFALVLKGVNKHTLTE